MRKNDLRLRELRNTDCNSYRLLSNICIIKVREDY